MVDKVIGELPQASTLTDNSSFVCEDSGEAKRVTGKQFKDFAKEGALPAVEAAESAADRAEAALTKAPKIQNGTWWVFDASSQAYVDTGVKAQGEQGIQGERGKTGAPGKQGEKGDPFRYEDFTPEQLDDLERGAKAAQAAAETAAASAATSAGQASVSEQNAAGSASAAKASQDAAKASENAASGSSSSAQESAASASASASEASASATAAAKSEKSAIEAKTAAETAKTEAGKSASAAKKSETASKASETAAAGSASAAQQSASAAAGSATAAAQSATSIGNAEQVVTQKAEEASTSAANAAASAESAARSAEHAEQVVGGDFATKTEAQGYANTAESNAKSYTDQQIDSIPTPDVSGQIRTHNSDSTAHNDIRELIDTKISAIPTPDVSGQIGEHNTNTEAHNDIRNLITGLTNRLNSLADSDDTTLDQLSEIVAYIKNNKTLIDGITTSKVNVTDIINNLTTNVTNKPLSAAQGVALKALIDAITVPTKVSELENDSGYLTSYTETDPTVPAWAKAETKPTYTANEVGARPNTWTPSASDVGAIPVSEKGMASGVATLGTNGKVPESQLPDISSVKTFTATIGTTWTENENTGIKSQNVSIPGVLAKHTAKVDHAYTGSGTSDDYTAFVEAENQYLTCITNGYAETYNGGITFYIFGDAPTVSIPIVVEVA